MISWTSVILQTGERRDALGSNPTGSLVYTPERVTVFVLKTGRKRPTSLTATVEEKIALYDTMFVYAGTYTVYPDRVIHHLDMSWNEAWTGTEQVRFYKLQGNRLTFTSTRPPFKGPATRAPNLRTPGPAPKHASDLILRAEADQWSSDNTRQSGRDVIDRAPGQHDDRINAAAGAIVLAATRNTGTLFTATAMPTAPMSAIVDGARACESVTERRLDDRSRPPQRITRC